MGYPRNLLHCWSFKFSQFNSAGYFNCYEAMTTKCFLFFLFLNGFLSFEFSVLVTVKLVIVYSGEVCVCQKLTTYLPIS